jgi:DNA-binding transcriptional ArsR family regulator
MDSALPPRYVKLPTQEAYDPDLSDALFRTLAQIRGLAYPKRKRTPPLTVGDLAALRGLSQATLFRHLAALRARGAIRTEPAGEHTFVIYLLRRRRGDERGKAARAAGEATPYGARDDGTAAIAGTHHQVDCFPLSREPGALSPAHERRDAAQAQPEGLPQPAADVYHGAARRRDGPSAGPDPPPLPQGRRERQAGRGSVKNESRTLKNENQSRKNESRILKNENQSRKNENLTLKNENRSNHVVVKAHDSKQEEDHEQQHEHDGAILKNESGFDGALHDLAGVLAAHGMRPGDAQRKARWLLEECGADVCARQRQVFERRCELARASRRGLANPVGLLCASIRGDWSLPAAANERKEARWFTDEEFEAFFEH